MLENLGPIMCKTVPDRGITSISFAWLKKLLDKPKIVNYRINQTFKEISKLPVILPRPLLLEQDHEINESSNFPKIQNIVDIFEAKFPRENKHIINRNLASLKIDKMKVSVWARLWNQYFDAAYCPKINTIKLGQNPKDLSHEMLHLASTYYDGKNLHSGFAFQRKEKGKLNEIGRGITEGYTSLLDLRYFQGDDKKEDGYSIERNTAVILDMIIGRRKMQEMYFNADGYSLVEELKEYDTEENVFKFLRSLDFLNYVLRDRKKVDNGNVNEAILFVSAKLQKWSFAGLNYLMKTNKIKEEAYRSLKTHAKNIIGDILNQQNKFNVTMYDPEENARKR